VKSKFCYIDSDYVNIHGALLFRLIEMFDHQLWHFDADLGGEETISSSYHGLLVSLKLYPDQSTSCDFDSLRIWTQST
jgi:hypothetical protein